MRTFEEFVTESYNYNDIPNIVSDYLNGKINFQDAKNQIYEATTHRWSKYQQIMNSNNSQSQTIGQWSSWFKNGLAKVETLLKNNGWNIETNPKWIGFDNQIKSQKIDGKTFKRYYTIDFQDIQKFFSNILQLANPLKQISQSSRLSIKFPPTFRGFATHRDTIVIHFYDPRLNNEVDRIVKDFFSQNGIKPVDRSKYVGASNQGVDVENPINKEKNSDTVLVVNEFLQKINQYQDYWTKLSQLDPAKFHNQIFQMFDVVSKNASHR